MRVLADTGSFGSVPVKQLKPQPQSISRPRKIVIDMVAVNIMSSMTITLIAARVNKPMINKKPAINSIQGRMMEV